MGGGESNFNVVMVQRKYGELLITFQNHGVLMAYPVIHSIFPEGKWDRMCH